jgi:hypothetical protein
MGFRKFILEFENTNVENKAFNRRRLCEGARNYEQYE